VAVEVVGDFRANGVVAGVLHIAVDVEGILVLKGADDRLPDLGRSRDGRVAEGEVEHVLLADPLRHLEAFLKKLADS